MVHVNIIQGPGGWGYRIQYLEESKEDYGGAKNTTNNKMELQAVIEALIQIEKDGYEKKICIYSDSIYVVKGITLWITGWKLREWKKVKNRELWEQLDTLQQNKDIEWNWVKAHSGNIGNERADALANMGVPV